MSSTRFGLVAVAVLASLAIQAAPAAAQETAAASCSPRTTFGSTNNGNNRFAQTFSPSLGGSLNRVELDVHNWVGATPGDYRVSINAVDGGGFPTDTVLATTTVPDPAPASGLINAVFGVPATVVGGQPYAVVVSRPGSTVLAMGIRFPADCPGGGSFIAPASPGAFESRPTSDMVFTAFVTPVDSDGDGTGDIFDNCPELANASQVNTDGDAEGDACDTDDDNDTFNDDSDSCPIGAASGLDSDGDGCKDADEDTDDDNDGVPDASDNCPTTAGAASSSGCQAQPDTDPPETTITKTPKDKGTKKKITHKFVAGEPGSTFECKLDDEPWKPCSSPRKYKVKVGKHKFSVLATDSAGNTDPTPAKDKFKVQD